MRYTVINAGGGALSDVRLQDELNRLADQGLRVVAAPALHVILAPVEPASGAVDGLPMSAVEADAKVLNKPVRRPRA